MDELMMQARIEELEFQVQLLKVQLSEALERERILHQNLWNIIEKEERKLQAWKGE